MGIWFRDLLIMFSVFMYDWHFNELDTLKMSLYLRMFDFVYFFGFQQKENRFDSFRVFFCFLALKYGGLYQFGQIFKKKSKPLSCNSCTKWSINWLGVELLFWVGVIWQVTFCWFKIYKKLFYDMTSLQNKSIIS